MMMKAIWLSFSSKGCCVNHGFEVVKKKDDDTNITLKSLWDDTSTVSSHGAMGTEDVCHPGPTGPVCQDASTSARHYCVQLSWKVAALWQDLKGIYELETGKRELQLPAVDWYLINSYLFSCLSR